MLAGTQKPMLGQMINWAHPLAKGLVGCWIMNEGSGDRIYDISGNRNNGDFGGNPLWNPGDRGQALAFDGANDYVVIADSASLNTITAITLSAWIKSSDIDGWIVGKDNVGAIRPYSVRRYDVAGDSIIRFGIDTGATVFLNGLIDMSDTQWVFVAATYDGVNMKIYIDGIFDTSVGETGNIRVNTDPVHIGIRGGGALPFNGDISSIMIWNRALSAQEVSQLYYEPYAMFLKAIPIWIYRIAKMIYIKRFRSKRTIYNFSAKGQAYYLKARNETYKFTEKAA